MRGQRLRPGRIALLAACFAAGVALAALASATPGPGGWDNLGTGAAPAAPAFNGAVQALAAGAPGTLYAGGAFTNAGGDATADNLALWDGTAWKGVSATPLAGAVNAIAFRNGRVYAGGAFLNAGGNADADFLAVWDGVAWAPVCAATGPALNGAVNALEIVGSTIFVGGAFSDAAGIAAADALVACDLGTGVPRATASAGLNGAVFALAADANGRLYAGGAFTDLDGIAAADRVASLAGGTWSALGPGVAAPVRSLAATGTTVYVGSDATDIAGIAQADHVARWNGSAWSALGANTAGTDGWLPGAATVDAIATSGSRVFVGGAFANANGDPLADDVAEFDGAAWKTVGSDGAGNGALDGRVRALATFAQQLVAGGSFANAGGNELADFLGTFPLAGVQPPPTTTAPPTTTQPPPQPPPGAPPTARATGTVLVNGRPFTSGTIFFQSIVDVTNGRLLVRADTGIVNLWGTGPSAVFVMQRGTDRSRRLVEFKLTGGNFGVCPRPRKGARPPATPVRRLWGDGTGDFRTRGRYASAIVRGTHWQLTDRCDGTFTRVISGVVRVADFPRQRVVTVRAGQTYLARP